MLWITVVILSTTYGAFGLGKHFPPGFKFGVATSAYQIEGGWNASDKGESIWDRATHLHQDKVTDRSNGNIAADSYHHWRRDVEMVHEMGLHFYRFSIAWTRVLPNAFPTKVSASGKKYYNDIINYLLEKGIEPIITLYHWDLPQKLQDLGGWTNPLVSDWFADYARVVFSLYADRVKTWITINEPISMCDIAYNSGNYAPLILEPEMAGLLCNKHILLAHAKAWRIYEKEYKNIYHGRMAIGNNLIWMEAKGEGDEELTKLAVQRAIGIYAHPIYSKEGGWPPLLEKAMAEYSKKAGYPRSKLPAFTVKEKALVKGTFDFFSINYYTARLVRRTVAGEKAGLWPLSGQQEFDMTLETDPNWATMGIQMAPAYPHGMRRALAWLKEQYGDLDFFITENGCHDAKPNDRNRMNYIRTHLEQVLLTIQDGVNITGYTYWSLMDNMEWIEGYTFKYGLYEVDFSDPGRARYPRASARYYSRIVRAHSLDVPFPEDLHTNHHRANNSNTQQYYNFLYILCLNVVYFCFKTF